MRRKKKKTKLYLFPDIGGSPIFMEENAEMMLKGNYEAEDRKIRRKLKKKYTIVEV